MFDNVIERETARVRFGNKMIGELAQVPIAIAPAERSFSGSFLDKCADAAARFQDARPFQLRINLGHRVGIDSQIDGHLPHRRQLVTDTQLSRGNRELNRPFELVIKRGWMFGVNVEHFALPYCATTMGQVKFRGIR